MRINEFVDEMKNLIMNFIGLIILITAFIVVLVLLNITPAASTSTGANTIYPFIMQLLYVGVGIGIVVGIFLVILSLFQDEKKHGTNYPKETNPHFLKGEDKYIKKDGHWYKKETDEWERITANEVRKDLEKGKDPVTGKKLTKVEKGRLYETQADKEIIKLEQDLRKEKMMTEKQKQEDRRKKSIIKQLVEVNKELSLREEMDEKVDKSSPFYYDDEKLSLLRKKEKLQGQLNDYELTPEEEQKLDKSEKYYRLNN